MTVTAEWEQVEIPELESPKILVHSRDPWVETVPEFPTLKSESKSIFDVDPNTRLPHNYYRLKKGQTGFDLANPPDDPRVAVSMRSVLDPVNFGSTNFGTGHIKHGPFDKLLDLSQMQFDLDKAIQAVASFVSAFPQPFIAAGNQFSQVLASVKDREIAINAARTIHNWSGKEAAEYVDHLQQTTVMGYGEITDYIWRNSMDSGGTNKAVDSQVKQQELLARLNAMIDTTPEQVSQARKRRQAEELAELRQRGVKTTAKSHPSKNLSRAEIKNRKANRRRSRQS